ncbi:MAG: TadE/TadG family type IV pilus assembly protein [Candidatus Baltobacteraceae bacterium]
MQLNHYRRGQTLLEFAIAMPIALFALFAIIYFARYAVVAERADLALRYGGIASFNAISGNYSAANIYQSLNGSLPSCPTPDPAILAGAGPMPGSTAAPFWQPDSDVAKSTSCTAGALGFGGAQFVASHFWATTNVNVTAGVDVPPYLQQALGNGFATASTSATIVHAAYPGIILWCSTEVRARVSEALTASGTAVLPTPIPDGSTPPPLPPNNNGSCN